MNNMIITEKNLIEQCSNLGNPDAIELVKTIVNDYVESREIGNAFYFSQKLEQCLRSRSFSEEQRRIYTDFTILLNLVAFPILGDEEQKNLLKQHVLMAVRNELDLRDRLHRVFYPYFRGRDDQVKLASLLKALEENQEQLGQRDIKFTDGRLTKPLIKNWIFDYKVVVGKQHGSLGIFTYLQKSSNAKLLSKDELEILKTVLSVYDWLRFDAVPEAILSQEILPPTVSEIRLSGAPSYLRAEKAPIPTRFQPVAPPPAPRPVSKVLPPPPRPPLRPPEAGFGGQAPKAGIRGEEKKGVLSTPSSVNNSPQPPLTLRGEEGGLGRGGGIKGAEGEKGRQELYRKTLEELRKMREGESTLRKSEIPSPPPNLPHQGGGMKGKERVGGGEGQAVGVNEALISAATKQSPQDRGSVMPGEKEVEEKLRKLEEKLK